MKQGIKNGRTEGASLIGKMDHARKGTRFWTMDKTTIWWWLQRISYVSRRSNSMARNQTTFCLTRQVWGWGWQGGGGYEVIEGSSLLSTMDWGVIIGFYYGHHYFSTMEPNNPEVNGNEDRRTGEQENRRTGGQADREDRRSGGQEDRRSGVREYRWSGRQVVRKSTFRNKYHWNLGCFNLMISMLL